MNETVRILVVDDEAMIVMTVEDALRQAGYDVEIAHCGSDALSMLERIPEIAGIVTDIRMGNGTTGWELGREARRHNPAVAIVYMSGDSAADYPAEGVPGSIIVHKPFAPDQIASAISTQLNKIASGLG
ncbi:response regulator [Sphingomonas sp.]|uniref:response regulator n=1 Tax=Sphingomonas sp. TaxID=28214 RepID=UPI0031E394CD